jgi:hypothetical protein
MYLANVVERRSVVQEKHVTYLVVVAEKRRVVLSRVNPPRVNPPSVNPPSVNLPSVNLPSVNLPSVSLPSVSLVHPSENLLERKVID